jgi:hypothetical protein
MMEGDVEGSGNSDYVKCTSYLCVGYLVEEKPCIIMLAFSAGM